MSRRILFISHTAARTGAPIGLLAFMQWVKEHTENKICTLLKDSGPLEDDFKKLGPCLCLLPSYFETSRIGRQIAKLLPQKTSSRYRKAHSFISTNKIDVIYANTSTNGDLLEELSKYKIPVLTHVHELSYWVTQAGEENWNKVTKHSTAYVAASHAVHDFMVEEKGLSSDKISVVYEHIRALPDVPTAAQKKEARQKLGIPDDAILIGGCGSEYWRKGKDLIPQLLIELRKLRPQQAFHFLWLGPKCSKQEEYAFDYDMEKSGFKAQFLFPGEVSDPFALYAALDSFALLSRDDPYPLACLEAAAMEIPIICFENSGGIPELAHKDSGLTAPYLDMPAFAHCIVQLAESETLKTRISKNARQNVDQDSMLKTTAPKLLEILTTITV